MAHIVWFPCARADNNAENADSRARLLFKPEGLKAGISAAENDARLFPALIRFDLCLLRKVTCFASIAFQLSA